MSKNSQRLLGNRKLKMKKIQESNCKSPGQIDVAGCPFEDPYAGKSGWGFMCVSRYIITPCQIIYLSDLKKNFY